MPLTTYSLVSTKLRPSQARPKLVARPRLIAELEREARRKLTLISAPAGFGKTTLLVEWLKGCEDGDQSVAWVSLDEGDNDPVRFLCRRGLPGRRGRPPRPLRGVAEDRISYVSEAIGRRQHDAAVGR